MIEKIARRAGGFASTTALRWMGAGVDKVADVTLVGGNGSHHGHGGRLVAGAAGAIALLSSSKTVRTGLERGLLAASKAVRATPASRSNRNGSNGNGTKDLTAKTRAELYELAKKVDLPGRSGMSKDELAKALKH